MTNFYNRLILHPKDMTQSLAQESLIEYLKSIELIAQPWHFQGQDYHLIGKRFLSHITFMGCAPSIEFEAPNNEQIAANFVAVEVPQTLAQASFLPRPESFQFRCPRCKNLSSLELPEQLVSETLFSCLHCQSEFNIQRFNWRHKAGVVRSYVSVMGVFPQEAIPSAQLMLELKQFSGGEWNYFYTNAV